MAADVVVDTVGPSLVSIETVSHGQVCGHSILISPDRAVILIDKLAEQPPVAQLLRERARVALIVKEYGQP